jgi:hypothetical protein
VVCSDVVTNQNRENVTVVNLTCNESTTKAVSNAKRLAVKLVKPDCAGALSYWLPPIHTTSLVCKGTKPVKARARSTILTTAIVKTWATNYNGHQLGTT